MANGRLRESVDTATLCLVPCNEPEKLSRSIPFKAGLVERMTRSSNKSSVTTNW